MADDIFCKIVAGELPSYKVYEDDKFLAFLDITPIRLGHTLLIPKEHFEYLFEMPEDLYGEMFLKARELAPAIMKAASSKRTGIVVEGLEVLHVHIHLIPLDETGGLDSTSRYSETAEKLTEMAEKIKGLLDAN